MDALPLIIPPLRFGNVQELVYRSGYPCLRNFRHLSRLKLKTIISLIPETPTNDLISFTKVAGIDLIHISVMRTAALNNTLQSSLISALNICIDNSKHPILIHCLDGKRITGLLVLLLRRLQGWPPVAALAEFWKYQASPKQQVSEIERTTRDIEKFALEMSEIIITDRIPKWLWESKRNTYIPGVKMKHIPPLETNITNATSTPLENSINRLSAASPSVISGDTITIDKTNVSINSKNNRQVSDVNLSRNDEASRDVSRSVDALSLHGLDVKKSSKAKKI
jgi:tyrosine-protein phosphatase OCA6